MLSLITRTPHRTAPLLALQTLLSYANNTPLTLTAPPFTEKAQQRLRSSILQNGSYSHRKVGGLDAIEETANSVAGELNVGGGNGTPVRRKSLLKSELVPRPSSFLVNTNVAATLTTTPSRKRSFVENNASNTNHAGEQTDDSNAVINPSIDNTITSIRTSDSSLDASPSPLPTRKKSSVHSRPSIDGLGQHRHSRAAANDVPMLTAEELQDEVGWLVGLL